MAANLAPGFQLGAQFFTDQGVVLSGGLLYVYAAGSTTPVNTYTDPTLSTPNSNPIALTSAGRLPQNVWLPSGQAYKFVLKTSTGVQVGQPLDYVYGVNDTLSLGASQWAPSTLTPTYVSSNTFTVPGNQLQTFLVGRRLQILVNAGVVYGTIATAAYSTVTTVAVTLDSGALDSGLSTVNVGIITPTNSAIPPSLISSGGGATGGGNDQFVVENDQLVTTAWTLGQDQQKACTISIATPAVVTMTNSFTAGQPVFFQTTGALPTGLSANTTYYVSATNLTTTSFQVSATPGGSSIATSGSQSGNQTCGKVKNGASVGPVTVNTGVALTIPTGARWVIS